MAGDEHAKVSDPSAWADETETHVSKSASMVVGKKRQPIRSMTPSEVDAGWGEHTLEQTTGERPIVRTATIDADWEDIASEISSRPSAIARAVEAGDRPSGIRARAVDAIDGAVLRARQKRESDRTSRAIAPTLEDDALPRPPGLPRDLIGSDEAPTDPTLKQRAPLKRHVTQVGLQPQRLATDRTAFAEMPEHARTKTQALKFAPGELEALSRKSGGIAPDKRSIESEAAPSAKSSSRTSMPEPRRTQTQALSFKPGELEALSRASGGSAPPVQEKVPSPPKRASSWSVKAEVSSRTPMPESLRTQTQALSFEPGELEALSRKSGGSAPPEQTQAPAVKSRSAGKIRPSRTPTQALSFAPGELEALSRKSGGSAPPEQGPRPAVVPPRPESSSSARMRAQAMTLDADDYSIDEARPSAPPRPPPTHLGPEDFTYDRSAPPTLPSSTAELPLSTASSALGVASVRTFTPGAIVIDRHLPTMVDTDSPAVRRRRTIQAIVAAGIGFAAVIGAIAIIVGVLSGDDAKPSPKSGSNDLGGVAETVGARAPARASLADPPGASEFGASEELTAEPGALDVAEDGAEPAEEDPFADEAPTSQAKPSSDHSSHRSHHAKKSRSKSSTSKSSTKSRHHRSRRHHKTRERAPVRKAPF